MNTHNKHPSYEERLKQNNIIDARGPDVNCKYTNSITGCDFWGLNHGVEDAPNFSATRIDEMNAFTLRMNNIAIIPRELFIELQKFMKHGVLSSSGNLRKAYKKYEKRVKENKNEQ